MIAAEEYKLLAKREKVTGVFVTFSPGMDTDDFMVRLMTARYSGMSNTSMENFITLMLRLEKISGECRGQSPCGGIKLFICFL